LRDFEEVSTTKDLLEIDIALNRKNPEKIPDTKRPILSRVSRDIESITSLANQITWT
jgi:uncharacterized alkaline shock family protein YloU